MSSVPRMTKDQFREMLGDTIEQKLIELLGDPDDGLAIRSSVRARLLRQKRRVARGERGELLEDVARRLGLQ
ncbi:MAG: hypothetical protein NTX53_10090 [candidate division WOR-3 bacterium]|nr:hypothetical protein [candidate division WOR-3 bacterium]